MPSATGPAAAGGRSGRGSRRSARRRPPASSWPSPSSRRAGTPAAARGPSRRGPARTSRRCTTARRRTRRRRTGSACASATCHATPRPRSPRVPLPDRHQLRRDVRGHHLARRPRRRAAWRSPCPRRRRARAARADARGGDEGRAHGGDQLRDAGVVAEGPEVCCCRRHAASFGGPAKAGRSSQIRTTVDRAGEDRRARGGLRPVLPDRARRRDLRRALDADHPAQPHGRRRPVRRPPRGRPGPPAQRAGPAAAHAGAGRRGRAVRGRAPLPADRARAGARAGVHRARYLGRAVAGESRPEHHDPYLALWMLSRT